MLNILNLHMTSMFEKLFTGQLQFTRIALDLHIRTFDFQMVRQLIK